MQDVTAGFTPDEWDVLLRSPVVVFLFIAAAEGKVQPPEVAAFQQVLASAHGYRSALLARVLDEVQPRLSMLLAQVLTGGQDAGRVLREARTIVEARLTAGEAQLFLQSLFYVGNQVARVTREADGVLRDGKAEALMTLARLFGLVPDE